MHQDDITVLRREQLRVKKEFPSFSTRIDYSRLILICKGQFEVGTTYDILVLYKPRREPWVYVLNLNESPRPDIHLHADGRLCLCYPPDHKWSFQDDLVRTAFCWTSEWLYNYELYKLIGTWQSKSVPHH